MPSLGNQMVPRGPSKPQPPRPQHQHPPLEPLPPPQQHQHPPLKPHVQPQQHQHLHQHPPLKPQVKPPPPPQPNVAQGYPQRLGVTPQIGVWTSGLCDCFHDVPNCCLTCWCPCITFGLSAEIIDRGVSSCGSSGSRYALIAMSTGFHFIYSCMYRTKLKQQYGMPRDMFGDCCLHFWCHHCALCQEYRELQHRGLDPALGWHGNLERRNNAIPAGVVTYPPGVQGGMTR